MRAFLESVLGIYTPNTVTVNGETVVLQGVASVDFTYLLTGIAFIVVIYCVLRMIGSFISR